MPKKIEIDGVKYPVTEMWGYDHSVGMYRAHVDTPDGGRTVVKHRGGDWRFWGASDRTQPLREALARGWLKKPKSEDG